MITLKKISTALGLDVATSSALLSKMWSLFSGSITLLMIIRTLTPQEQGFIGIFESIVAVRIFVELGLTTVLMQFISHERGDLEINRKVGIRGSEKNLINIASLLKNGLRWYAFLSIAIFFIIWIGATKFFAANSENNLEAGLQLPILLLGVNTALSLLTAPLFGLLEGLGRIGEYFLVGLMGTILSSLSLWLFLNAGYGILSIPVSAFFGLIPGLFWLLRWRRLFCGLLNISIPTGGGIPWKKDILPLQLRTAVTAILGYFIFSLTLPLVFAMMGSVAAGQLSQTFRLTTIILGLANSWIIARAALYGRLISLSASEELCSIFRRSVLSAVSISVGGCLILAIPLWLATKIDASSLSGLPLPLLPILETIAKVPARLANPSVMLALGCNTILSSFIYALHSFVRAHRKEPFILNAVVAAITVPLITYIGARYESLELIAWGYFLRTLIIEIPLTLWIFSRHSTVNLHAIFKRADTLLNI